MTVSELIDELCAIRDRVPGNGDMPVCTEQEVQLGELDTPMTDLAVDVAWFDGGTIRHSLNDCQKCYPAKVCYLHESENNGDFI